ncbi:MAG: hypothetical protein J5805_05200 [Bacteroidaceae bacterium]|nr:hypothetical protein [Bacteroidaceae bacterium]
MKKVLLLAAASAMAVAFGSCNGTTNGGSSDSIQGDSATVEATPEVDPFPWDFPSDIALKDATDGSWALSCYTFYPNAIEDGKDLTTSTLIFYSTDKTKYGEGTSQIGDANMPNSLVIPIPADQKAKKGDVLLTWWQSGSGLQRAIVIDDADPSQPKVQYLDLSFSEDGTGMAQKFEDQLKPNSFIVLKDGEWTPGAQVACCDENNNYKAGTIINATDDKVLVLGFADKIKAYDKSNCKLVPAYESLNVGDAVSKEFVGTYNTSKDYKITKIDKTLGRVWVAKDGSDPEILNILQVTKAF